MFKRIFLFILCTIVLTFPYANIYAQVQDIEQSPLEKIIQYAVTHSEDLAKIDSEINKLSIELNDSRELTKNIKDTNFPIGTAGSLDNQVKTELIKRGHTLKTVEYAYNNLLTQREQLIESIKVSITQSYTAIIQLQNKKKYLEKSIDKLNRLIKIANLRVQLNMATELDVRTITDQLDIIKNQLEQIQNNEQSLKRDLLKFINAPENFELIIVDNFIFDEKQEYREEEILEKALSQRLDLKQLKDALELEQLKINVYKSIYPSSSSKIKIETITLNNTKKDIEQKIRDIESEISDKIKDIALLRQAYINSKIAYENIEKTNKINKLKYNLGLISTTDYMDSELAVIDIYNKSREALFKYINAKMELDLIGSYGKINMIK
jgi:outer membrane protein TolC